MPLGREVIEDAVKYHFMKDKNSADGVGKAGYASYSHNAGNLVSYVDHSELW